MALNEKAATLMAVTEIAGTHQEARTRIEARPAGDAMDMPLPELSRAIHDTRGDVQALRRTASVTHIASAALNRGEGTYATPAEARKVIQAAKTGKSVDILTDSRFGRAVQTPVVADAVQVERAARYLFELNRTGEAGRGKREPDHVANEIAGDERRDALEPLPEPPADFRLTDKPES